MEPRYEEPDEAKVSRPVLKGGGIGRPISPTQRAVLCTKTTPTAVCDPACLHALRERRQPFRVGQWASPPLPLRPPAFPERLPALDAILGGDAGDPRLALHLPFELRLACAPQ